MVDRGLTSIPWEDPDSTLVQAIQRESDGLTLGDLKDGLRPQDAIETIPGGDEHVVTNTNAPNCSCYRWSLLVWTIRAPQLYPLR